MKRYLKVLLVATVLTMTAIVIGPPGGQVPNPMSKRIPVPGKPPIIVVFPGSK